MFGRRRASKLDPAAVEEALEQARLLVLPGFRTQDEAAQALCEYLEEGTLDEQTLRGLVDQVWRERQAEERTWTDEGDYTRVAAAFAELERAGFVTRMDFTCCQTCGHAEIGDEATAGEGSYVFFHQQDTERLAEPDAQLYLAFGCLPSHPAIDQALYARAAEGDEDARATIGPVFAEVEITISTQIVAVLERQGLTVDRPDPQSRPAVRVREWRKRLPA